MTPDDHRNIAHMLLCIRDRTPDPDDARVLGDAADALRQCAEQRPDGWRLVPVEPTPEMLGAGSYAVDLHSHSPIGVYAAMLAAAPVPPQREPAHDIPLFDFDAEAWKQVLAAARDSKWMPAEYAMNDWLADICQWLRDGPPAGEQREPLSNDWIIDTANEIHRALPVNADEQVELLQIVRAVERAHGIGGSDER